MYAGRERFYVYLISNIIYTATRLHPYKSKYSPENKNNEKTTGNSYTAYSMYGSKCTNKNFKQND